MRKKVAIGILIGMGIMLVMLGFFGWLHTNYTLEKLSYMFEYVGIDIRRNYLIDSLYKLMWYYVIFVVLGFVALLAGGSLGIKVKKKRRLTDET